jgi:hypothetical protein
VSGYGTRFVPGRVGFTFKRFIFIGFREYSGVFAQKGERVKAGAEGAKGVAAITEHECDEMVVGMGDLVIVRGGFSRGRVSHEGECGASNGVDGRELFDGGLELAGDADVVSRGFDGVGTDFPPVGSGDLLNDVLFGRVLGLEPGGVTAAKSFHFAREFGGVTEILFGGEAVEESVAGRAALPFFGDRATGFTAVGAGGFDAALGGHGFVPGFIIRSGGQEPGIVKTVVEIHKTLLFRGIS